MVWSEGNMSLKNPVTTPGIDPGTVRLVAQRLNHYTTPAPTPQKKVMVETQISNSSTTYSLGTNMPTVCIQILAVYHKALKKKMAAAIKKDFSTSRYRQNVLHCKGKDIPFLTMNHTAKTYKGAKVQLHAFSTSAQDGSGSLSDWLIELQTTSLPYT